MKNIILNTDSYKASHYLQYPPKSEFVSSYIEARGGEYDEVLFFGLQVFIKEYLLTPFTQNDIDEAKDILDSQTPVLSIGTTSARTVEFYDKHGKVQSGEANLFLHPQNRPSRVNHLLTNFHLPKSTLLMLVASFVGLEKTQELYAEAIKEKYRFYSYGDAMLII